MEAEIISVGTEPSAWQISILMLKYLRGTIGGTRIRTSSYSHCWWQ